MIKFIRFISGSYPQYNEINPVRKRTGCILFAWLDQTVGLVVAAVNHVGLAGL